MLTAAVLFLAGTLSGCMAAPVPPNTAPPVAKATAAPAEAPPIFASNDEALAAAEAAYAAYEALSDSITADGGTGGDRIEPAASPKYLPDLLDSFVGFSKTGFISRGSSTFDNVSLIRNSVEPRGGVSIELYLCSDISEVRLIDKTGADVTPAGRTNRTPLQVGFTSSAANPSLLLLDKEDVWSGRNFC
ncbi:hypothetical protein E3T31_03160 [Cryobacterium sp. TMS1-13-1]|nr:hypothetical protein E3T31_03160 [Cryobacterium sp. TMS1-13-1]